MYKRLLMNGLPPKTTCFVLGPRQTGKTTLLETVSTAMRYDLLVLEEYLRLNRDPDLVYQECSRLDAARKHIVWIDEVQKIPALLDVVHRTIEKFRNISFILSGSSARKLKSQGVNLLGGRAIEIKFHPLTSVELGADFHLQRALEYGTLPKIYSLVHGGEHQLAKDLLYSYVSTYLEEEIRREALVRDLQPFQRFLEVAAQSAGTLINFAKIADESQISHTSTTNYFSILEDTMIGFLLPSYHSSVRKQLAKQPKFYLFDNGVTRALLNTLDSSPSGLEKGVLFEQFVIQEVRRINDYYKKRFKLYLWRTEAGAEVDLILTRGKQLVLAIECKASRHVSKRDLSGLKAFKRDHPKVRSVVCAPVEREVEVDTGFDAVPLERLLQMIIEA